MPLTSALQSVSRRPVRESSRRTRRLWLLPVITLAAVTAAAPLQAQPASPQTVTAQPVHPLLQYPMGTVVIPSDPTCSDIGMMLKELNRAKLRLDDWGALGRYREANAQLAPPSAAETRVVFMGDSITDAWDDPKYGGFFPGKPWYVRGISGQTTPQMLLRMRADVIALKPKAMVLLAGTNDLASNTGTMTIEQTEDNIATIAELATLHGIKVVLASILPVSNYHVDPKDPRGPQTTRRPMEKIKAINAWMKAYAAKNGHVYLDYFSATVDAQGLLKAELSSDDLHPNAAGYAIMAPLAEAAIAQALSK